MSEPQPTAPPQLVLLTEKGEEVPVTGTSFLIGRSRVCDFQPDSASLSPRHALLQREADGWTVEDQGSARGSWLNQKPLSGRVRISDGDELVLGLAKLILRLR
ncbi:FHA domain-containing protein [Corallococcus exercitus]|uniref:FHA domain-containing protein n=1 Tax=Corallococcus exercitus TaxID=2316736 RepID=UPI0035D44BFB